MRILFCGDIVGKAGRKIVIENIPKVRKKLKIDCVIANAENAAHGFGITPKIYDELMKAGIDIITLGNHAFDQPIITDYLNSKDNIIRPINYIKELPGKGFCLSYIKETRILVVNLMGALFMGDKCKEPFSAMEDFLSDFSLGKNADLIIVDFHAEATSEKNALAFVLNGRVSAVLGTHTHVPTNDARILSLGTAYQTDVGMCGDYTSVIGMETPNAVAKLKESLRGINNKIRLEPAAKEATLAAVVMEFNVSTGFATKIEPVIIGGALKSTTSGL